MNSSAGAGNYRRGSIKGEKVIYILKPPLFTSYSHTAGISFISMRFKNPPWPFGTVLLEYFWRKTILSPLARTEKGDGQSRVTRCLDVEVLLFSGCFILISNFEALSSDYIKCFLSVSHCTCFSILYLSAGSHLSICLFVFSFSGDTILQHILLLVPRQEMCIPLLFSTYFQKLRLNRPNRLMRLFFMT